MSSSSQVRLAYIAEATYGVTPASGNFDTIRFNSEGLNGQGRYTSSAEVRSDRQPVGQTLTGLAVGGPVAGNLAPTTWVNDFLESGMRDTWNAKLAPAAASYDITTSGTKLTRASGSFVTDGVAVGDLIELDGFSTANNNTLVYVSAVAALELTIVGPTGTYALADEAGSGDETYVRHAYCEIGTDVNSFTICRTPLDLTSKGITYRGEVVGGFDVNIAKDGNATINFQTAGGGPNPWEVTDDSDGRTVNAAGTESPLTGVNNIRLIVVDGAAVGYCVDAFTLSLNNNLQARDCIGQIGAKNQDANEASVTVNLTVHQTDANFDLHAQKTDGTKMSVIVPILNSGEGYAFVAPAFQPDFQDGASPGKNQQILLNISGMAEPTTTQNALRVYKITQA